MKGIALKVCTSLSQVVWDMGKAAMSEGSRRTVIMIMLVVAIAVIDVIMLVLGM